MTKIQQAKDEWAINKAILQLVTLQGTLELINKKLHKQEYETALEYLQIAFVRTETTLLALEKLLNEYEHTN